MGSERISISHPRFVGLALSEWEGTAVVTPAWRTTGHLWWKRLEPGFAVQIVQTQFENCGAFVDCYKVWRCKGFFTSRAQATAFRDELISTGATRRGGEDA